MPMLEVEKHGLRLDLTVNLGQILTALAMLAAVISAYWSLSAQIALTELRTTANETTILKTQERLDSAVDFLQSIKTDIAIIRFRLDDSARKENKVQGG